MPGARRCCLITAAQKAAQDLRDADIAATREELGRLREQATAEIAAERDRALAELRAQVADLALAAAGKVVGETMTDARQRRLVDEFLRGERPGRGREATDAAPGAGRRYAEAAFAAGRARRHGRRLAARPGPRRRAGRGRRVARTLDSPRSRSPGAARGVEQGARPATSRPTRSTCACCWPQRGRFAILPEVSAEYDALLRRSRGIVAATVTTPGPLSGGGAGRGPGPRGAARRRAGRAGATATDPSLIGGLTVRIGDRLIDASVRGRLERLRERLAREPAWTPTRGAASPTEKA